MVARVSQDYLRKLMMSQFDHISQAQRDEMAIPSYLHGNPLIRWLMWKRYEVIAQMLGINNNASALEFGCGTGIFLPTLCKRVGEVWAIDLIPDFAQKLTADMGLNVSFAKDLSDVPDSYLDFIVAADVLEHVDDLVGIIQTFCSRLKPGGHLIVSGPTESPIYKLGRVFAGFGDKGDYHHRNIDDICAALSGEGFQPLSARNLPCNAVPALFRIINFQMA